MRAIAAILCVYLFGLCVQPALFPLHQRENKKLSCCAEKNKPRKDRSCPKDGCCDGDQCNPFFSFCPICAANAVAVYKYTVPKSRPEFFNIRKYYLQNERVESRYHADILHPPNVV